MMRHRARRICRNSLFENGLLYPAIQQRYQRVGHSQEFSIALRGVLRCPLWTPANLIGLLVKGSAQEFQAFLPQGPGQDAPLLPAADA